MQVGISAQVATAQDAAFVRDAERLGAVSVWVPEAERAQYYGDGPVEFSHTLTEQIGSQLAAGFRLTGLVEAPHHADATARFMPGYIATRAIRPA